jgi:hypothetical protein
MKFLDKKEQVLDIQMTQYGKRLLAKGNFKPHYYAFFDDDIIYDTAWIGYGEEQNESQGRILDAPRPETQYNFSGVETKVNEQDKINFENAQNELNRESLLAPLNTASPTSNYVPSWDVRLYEGEIDNSGQTYKSGSLSLKIPQLSVNLVQDIKISFSDEVVPEEFPFGEPEGMSPEDDHPGYRFPDGTYHFLDDSRSSLFAKILEQNIDFEEDNYEIEVYKQNPDDELERLYFLNDTKIYVKDGILLDEPEIVQIVDFGPKYVEYYFDLLTDSEIPNEIYCKAINKDTLEDLYSDEILFNCDDVEQEEDFSDIYKISKEADEEPC